MRVLLAATAVLAAVVLTACGSSDDASRTPLPAEPAPTTTAPVTSAPAKPGPTKLAHLPDVVEAKAVIVKKAPPPPPPPKGVPCGAGAAACVDLSANQAWLLSSGKVAVGPVPITTGRPGHETPPGTFHVQYKDIDHLSREFDNAPMPYSVFFNDGIAFHEGSLYAQSHGCVHLSASAAESFFAGLAVGDVVQVVP
jgi:lipoprotein-anchoring transpeptidase ErfK/SrfK